MTHNFEMEALEVRGVTRSVEGEDLPAAFEILIAAEKPLWNQTTGGRTIVFAADHIDAAGGSEIRASYENNHSVDSETIKMPRSTGSDKACFGAIAAHMG